MQHEVKRPYRSPARAAAAEETRRRIRDAATELFLTHGYPGTTLREVAERAGVGERTIYDGFGTKFRLYRHTVNILTLGDDHRTPAADRPDAVSARSLPDARDALTAHCAIGAALMERAGDLIMVGEAAVLVDPELERSIRRSRDATYEVHLMLAQRLEDRHELKAGLTAREAADILTTISSPAVFHSLRRERRWSARHYQEWMTTTLIQLLLEVTKMKPPGCTETAPSCSDS